MHSSRRERKKIVEALKRLTQPEYKVVCAIQEAIRQKDCRTGLDVGCGKFSTLTALRPGLWSTGIDVYAPAIEEAKRRDLHDHYIVGDIMRYDFCGQRFDVVVANEVIEHLDKWSGWGLLRRLEALATRLVIVTTPNGFLPQGTEFGNPSQRHQSGWFAHELVGLGYSVSGIFGPKFMRGYAGQLNWRGARILNPLSELLGRLLAPWPQAHFSLLAIKDLGDVPARLNPTN